jgi:hypothetical protein
MATLNKASTAKYLNTCFGGRSRLLEYAVVVRRSFFWADHVFGLSISPEICRNQHFLGETNLLYVLFKADFRAMLYFFLYHVVFSRIFRVLLKVREPVQALYT